MLRIFHIIMIAYFSLYIIGCGYKDRPYYQKETTQTQQNSTQESSIKSIHSTSIDEGEGD